MNTSRRPSRATRGSPTRAAAGHPGRLLSSAAAAGLQRWRRPPRPKVVGGIRGGREAARRPGFVTPAWRRGGTADSGLGRRPASVRLVAEAAALGAAAGGGSGQGPIWARMGLAGRGLPCLPVQRGGAALPRRRLRWPAGGADGAVARFLGPAGLWSMAGCGMRRIWRWPARQRDGRSSAVD